MFHRVANEPRHRAKIARSEENIDAVRLELQKDVRIRSPKRTPKRIGQRLMISKSSVHRIIKFDLHLKPFKKMDVQKLSHIDKVNRLARCQALSERFNVRKIRRKVFCDETTFTVTGNYNQQNCRVYAANRRDISNYELLNETKNFDQHLMVFLAVSYQGKFLPIFVPQGQTINALYYQNEILRPCIVEANNLYPRQACSKTVHPHTPLFPLKII